MRQRSARNQKGFTIIELMIATSIFSTILVMVTAIMISIGNLFYKGVSQAKIQDAVRSVTDDVSQHLELNDQDPIIKSQAFGGVTIQAYCIGDTRYSFVIGPQITATTHVLWRDKVPSTGCAPANLTTNPPGGNTGGSELVPDRSRLTDFSIAIIGSNTYRVNVQMANGDDDLLCDNGTAGDCQSVTPSTHIWNPNPPAAGNDIICKGRTGDQFCATSKLSIDVVKRL